MLNSLVELSVGVVQRVVFFKEHKLWLRRSDVKLVFCRCKVSTVYGLAKVCGSCQQYFSLVQKSVYLDGQRQGELSGVLVKNRLLMGERTGVVSKLIPLTELDLAYSV